MTIKRILHATDFSGASRPALRMAQALARTFKAELILCHVYQPVTPLTTGEGYVTGAVVQRLWRAARTSARGKLDRLVKSAKGDRLRVSLLLVEGAAAAGIVRAARRRRADLVVLGTHGRTGVRRVLLGSVAERVVRTASAPVLTVRARSKHRRAGRA